MKTNKRNKTQPQDDSTKEGINQSTDCKEIQRSPQEFVKIEKNLASLGFFTASSNKKSAAKKKTIKFTRTINGKKIEASATVIPSAEYGLPGVAEQDTWFAIQKIADDMRLKLGKAANPIEFTTAEILTEQGKSKTSGFHYKEVEKQLKCIRAATIESKGAVFLANKKISAQDIFGVIDRVVIFGSADDDGATADKNYVWLSQWQLDNINNNHLLPIDYNAYKRLKTHIAKALVPLLQIWLYATREEGRFEKRYDELCEHLGVVKYRKLSYIQGKFCPALDELQKQGYLSKWKIERTSDKKDYKIIFYHGEKFYLDRLKRIAQTDSLNAPLRKPKTLTDKPPETDSIDEPTAVEQSAPNILTDEQEQLIKRLKTDFGVSPAKAQELVLKRTEQTRRQLDAWPYRETKAKNRAGWIIDAINNNYDLPDAYAAAKEKELAEARRQRSEAIRKACSLCNGSGFIYVSANAVRPCRHESPTTSGHKEQN